jgi:hypothetical protein
LVRRSGRWRTGPRVIPAVIPVPHDASEEFRASIASDEVAGVGVHHVTSAALDHRHEDHLFVYVHGGGDLSTIAVQHAARDGIDVPGALYLGTPGNDMSDVGDTLHINRGIDRARRRLTR